MKKLLRFLPGLIWMLVIFYFSSRTTAGVVEGTLPRFLFFKSLHLIEYAVLAILFYIGYRRYYYSLLTAYVYAISDETHQLFVTGREGKISDTFVDLLGITLGLLLTYLFLRFYPRMGKIYRPRHS